MTIIVVIYGYFYKKIPCDTEHALPQGINIVLGF